MKLLGKIDSISVQRIEVLISTVLAASALGGILLMTVNECHF
jgi:hypothetical protein